MPLICVQCALRAVLKHEPPPKFEETPEAHMARCHPDPVENQRERRELEARVAEHLARADAAREGRS